MIIQIIIILLGYVYLFFAVRATAKEWVFINENYDERR